MHMKYIGCEDDMFSKSANSKSQKKHKSRNTELSQNSCKEIKTKSAERTKEKAYHKKRNRDIEQIPGKQNSSKRNHRERASSHNEKRSSRCKYNQDAIFKEINTITSEKYVERSNNIHKSRKHRPRSSENFNTNLKVKPELLRREKTIHVEKVRKNSDLQSTKREKRNDEKGNRKHKNRSNSQKKPNRIEGGDFAQQILYCQIETTNPFQKAAENNELPVMLQPNHPKEKVQENIKNSNTVSKRHKSKTEDHHIKDADLTLPEKSNGNSHHRKKGPKISVGKKPLKHSAIEFPHLKKNKRRNKTEINSHEKVLDIKPKRTKKKSAEGNDKDSPSHTYQFQEKIEDDLKSYFTRIQSLIDRKIDALFQNYKSKIKLKGDSDIMDETVKKESRERHRSRSRKRLSHKDRHESRNKLSNDQMEQRLHPSVERHCEPLKRQNSPLETPKRHRSPLETKYDSHPHHNCFHCRETESVQRRSSPHPEYPPRYSSTLSRNHEKPHRHCSPAGRNQEDHRHNSPGSRHHHSSSSGRNFESIHLHRAEHGKNYGTAPAKTNYYHNYTAMDRDTTCHKKEESKSRGDTKEGNHRHLSNSAKCSRESSKNNTANSTNVCEQLKPTTTARQRENSTNTKPYKENNFRVEGIEPAKLLEPANKPPIRRVTRNLECKTVSIIRIPSQKKKHSLKNLDQVEEPIERKKKTKRFKLYYKYSRDDNYVYPQCGSSSEGKSIISDSLRVLSDESECHIEMYKTKKARKKQNDSTKKTSIVSKSHKSNNTVLKCSPKENINNEFGAHKLSTSADSKLNNITEETGKSSSGEHNEIQRVDYKYFKGLHSSSSDYCMKLKKKDCDLIFQNVKMNVEEEKERKNVIKHPKVTAKSKRKRLLTNECQRKINNPKHKRKEQKSMLISKSDVNISYNSLIEKRCSSGSSATGKLFPTRKYLRTLKTLDHRKSKQRIDVNHDRCYKIPQKISRNEEHRLEMEEGHQIHSPMKAFNEIGLNQISFDKSKISYVPRSNDVHTRNFNDCDKNEKVNHSLLHKIYYLIESQYREKSEGTEIRVEHKNKKEQEVQAMTVDEIASKESKMECTSYEMQTKSEEKESGIREEYIVKDVITQKTEANDVGTETDKSNLKKMTSKSLLRKQNDVVTQKNDFNDIGIDASPYNLFQKVDMAVEVNTLAEDSKKTVEKVDISLEVNTTEECVDTPIEKSKKKGVDTAVEVKITEPKVVEVSSLHKQFFKPNDDCRPKSVSQKKKSAKRDMKREKSKLSTADKEKNDIIVKPASLKTRIKDDIEVEEIRNQSCESKVNFKSKIPTSKKSAIKKILDKNLPTESKWFCKLCDKYDKFTNLKKSKSEISFRNIKVDTEESKITSLVCLHKYKFDASSKSNTHSLDRYIGKSSNGEHPDSSRLFLTKDYRTSDISAYHRRKIYDEAIRKKMKRRNTVQSKGNLAPQVFEVRFLTVLENSNIIRNCPNKNIFSQEDTILNIPEYSYNSNIPELVRKLTGKESVLHTNLTGSAKTVRLCPDINLKGMFSKTNIKQSKLCEYYQEMFDPYLSSKMILSDYKYCFSGQNVVNIVKCLCNYIIARKIPDCFPDTELFRNLLYICNKVSLPENVPEARNLLSEEQNTFASANNFNEEQTTNKILNPNFEEYVDNADRKLVITGHSSCPLLKTPDSSFDFLYQSDSSNNLSARETVELLKKPINTILGFAFNGNASKQNVKCSVRSPLDECDFESEESGYLSTKSKTSLSYTSFFKKPTIVALLKPQRCISIGQSETSNDMFPIIPKFTDYAKMNQKCHEYVQKVIEHSKSKGVVSEIYEEIPLDKLIGRKKLLHVNKNRSDSSVFEKKLLPERKDSAHSEPILKIVRNTCVYETIESDPHSYQNENDVSLIFKRGDVEDESLPENLNILHDRSPNNVESEADMELLQKILHSEVVLSTTNLSTYCITIVESKTSKSSEDTCKDMKNDFHGNHKKYSSRNRHSDYDILNCENTTTFRRMISKKFFENLLEVYEKEIVVSSALLQDGDFLENELFSIVSENNQTCKTLKKKSSFRRKIKIFMRKVFNSKTRCESEGVFAEDDKIMENMITPVDADYQEKLQALAREAYKYFSMYVKAVELNQEINDEIKICGLLKLLERIEKGHFRFLRRGESVNFEEEIKDQVKQAFNEIYCYASSEAERRHRNLSASDVHLIAAFVCKYRIGLLSRTDIIASYIGRGLFETEEQLKAAVLYLMKTPNIDLRDFQMYCVEYLNKKL